MDREIELKLVQRVVSGDTEAFSALVLAYEKQVFNIALRMVGNREDAEDISQDSFIKAYNSLSSFRGESSFSSWLFRIVSNTCLDHLRKQKNHQTLSLSTENEDEETEEFDIADESFSPEELLEKKLTKESIQRGLGKLSEEHRAVLVLREIQGMSYDEIADALQIESGTVKSRIARARKKLCAFLVQDGNIPEYISSNYKDGGEKS